MASQTLRSEWGQDPLTVDAKVPTVALRYHLGNVHVGTPMDEVLNEVSFAIERRRDSAEWTEAIIGDTLSAAAWLHRENGLEYRAVMAGAL